MTQLVPYVRQPGWVAHDELLHALRTCATDFDIVALDDVASDRLADVDVAIVDGATAQQLAALPNLRWVQSTWAGVDVLLGELPEHIRIARMIDPQLTETMCEAALAWTLYLHRDMPRYARQQRVAEWRIHPPVKARERRIGVIGLGVLGGAAATTLAAQGFPVAGWSRTARSYDGVETFHGPDGLRRFLGRSDIVLNLLPHTEATIELLSHDEFAAMPVGSSLINFGRGPTVDDEALLAALDSGHLAHAVLDVFDVEPLPVDHRFWSHDSVTVLPHISGPTTAETAAVIAVENVRRYLATGQLPTDALADRTRGY